MSQLRNARRGSAQIRQDQIEDVGPRLDPRFTEDGAVQLVIQDAQKATTFLDNKQWNLFWRESDVLYQSPRTNQSFEGSTVARANISRFTVAEHVNSLVPTMKGGIFYEMPPFVIRPRPSMNQDTARAKTALFGALLDEADFESEAELMLEDMTTFGTVIVKYVFDKYTLEKKIRRPKKSPLKQDLPFGKKMTIHTAESDELQEVDTTVEYEDHVIERCDLGSVLVDPTWRKPNQLHKAAKYVIHATYPTLKDLDRMRQQVVKDDEGKVIGGYDIPTEEDLRGWFWSHPENAGTPSQVQLNQGGQNWAIHHAQDPNEPGSVSPVDRPIKMLERWDRTYVYSVLCVDNDRGVLIRKEEHGLPFIPFFSANFWNIPNAGFGLGVGRLAGSDQRIEKGLIDALLDILSYICNPQYARDRGANVSSQQIRQRLGGIVDVDAKSGDVSKAFRVIEPLPVPGEIFPTLQDSRNRARQATGADEAFTGGNVPQKGATALRSATVGSAIQGANTTKIQGPVGRFVRGILLPILELMDFFVKQRMTPGKIREILSEQMEKDFELDMQNFYEGKARFECLAGAHLAAKKAMAQALPILAQIFENPALVQQLTSTGWVIDAKELVNMFMEVTEWKNEKQLVRRMTAQERKMHMQSNPAAAKVQGQVTAIAARHQAKTAEIDQQNEAQLARDMIGRADDQAALFDERSWDRQAINQSEFAPA